MIELQLDKFSLSGKTILDDIHFAVERGSMVNIVGPNGSGKTTIMRILAGLYSIESGLLRYAIPSEKISFLNQKSEFAEDITINDFLRLSGFKVCQGHLGRYKNYLPEIESLMECLGLRHSLDTLIAQLSGGEFQKWRIIAATYWDPEILLLDEPCSFLDPKHQDEIMKLLKHFVRDQKKTVVMVSHDINQVLNSDGLVYALKNGKNVFKGNLIDFHNDDILSKLFDKKFILTSIDKGRYAL